MTPSNGTEADAIVRTDDGNIVIPPSTSEGAAAPLSDRLPAQERATVETELKSDQDRRLMRRWAFAYFVVLSILFFGILIQFLTKLIDTNALPAIIGAVTKPHAAFVLSLLIIVIATVPMSLAFALIKLSAEREKGGESGGGEISPPQLKAIQGLLDLVKSLIGK